MMPSYLRPGLRVLIWSLLLAISLTYSTILNPFLGAVLFWPPIITLVVQLILMRRKGWAYIGVFLFWLIVLTTVFVYADNKIFNHPRRYYAIG
jgi:hypothetical protein